MSDAQVWTLIGGFFAITVAYNAMLLAMIRAKFDLVDTKLDHLDRDVQGIAKRVFPE